MPVNLVGDGADHRGAGAFRAVHIERESDDDLLCVLSPDGSDDRINHLRSGGCVDNGKGPGEARFGISGRDSGSFISDVEAYEAHDVMILR